MPLVYLDRLNGKPDTLTGHFRQFFSVSSFPEHIRNATSIFIKPNLTYPVYKKGVTTRKDFVESLVEAILEVNSSITIYIGEGEGGYNSYSMTQAMTDMGYFEIEKKYQSVKVVNLSQMPSRTVELRANGKPYPVKLPSLLLDEVDFSISCPLPKVHCMTKISLSFKNQWGCLPDVLRLKNHFVLDEILGQVCEKLKFRYAFLDGKYGLDDNGPMVGDPIEINWFAAADSLGAFDMIVSEMMGFDWEKIGHLKTAAQYGCIPERKNIDVIGDLDALKRQFVLNRDFWNYPPLVAFHSKALTNLVYISKFAKPLHDIMYLFRKRPIT